MQKIEATSPETQSVDILPTNIDRLRALFPELITEGESGVSINIDVLKVLVGDKTVTDADEKYGLNWHGKRNARQMALTPSTGTLRPCIEDSLDWDTTKNLMIEGDNLEVLKLLQKSYANKVKLIYIDPPYNTGKDFVYPDNFQDNVKNYLELTGQIDGGKKFNSNLETSGRFHTDWLNMMYPRLKLARNLLREDGAIIVSIGDEEIPSISLLLREVFGEENLSANFIIIRSEGGGLAKQVVKGHDYLLVYAKSLSDFQPLRKPKDIRGQIVELNGKQFWIEEDWLRKEFGKYGTCPYAEIEKFHGAEKKRQVDAGLAQGIYRLISKRDGVQIVGRLRDIETDSSKFYSVQKHLNSNAAEDLKLIDMPPVFDFPKPLTLITELVLGGSFFSKNNSDIILDFFAGSGTTGHAVMAQNAFDGGNRQFILVQLPEPLDPENSDQKEASDFCDLIGKARKISELTKERLRRAAIKIGSDFEGATREPTLFLGTDRGGDAPDLGFRVFKLDSSNIRAWSPNSEDIGQTLLNHEDHILEERTEEDIFYELLLKFGLNLSMNVEKRVIGKEGSGKNVLSIGSGLLFACLANEIVREDVEPLAQGIISWQKKLSPVGDPTCIFRDSAFLDDVTKTNLAAILEQAGIRNVRSL